LNTAVDEHVSDYVDVKEATAILGVSRASLDNYARAGRLTRFEQGAPRRVLYKRSELNLLKRVRPRMIQ
jgi:predicted site-specific integrase-resolvase